MTCKVEKLSLTAPKSRKVINKHPKNIRVPATRKEELRGLELEHQASRQGEHEGARLEAQQSEPVRVYKVCHPHT